MRCGFFECKMNPERRPWIDWAAPFDDYAARAIVESIDLSACKDAGPTRGAGHASVTFHPFGFVYHVQVDGAPFAGTRVGRCIVEKLRTARVAPFKGTEGVVDRSFSLE